MHLAMLESEGKLLRSFMRCSSNYLEFGCGGSTCLAVELVKGSVVSIDSSYEWLDKVDLECKRREGVTSPVLHHVDIGPTGDWGYPVDLNTRDMWPNYHQDIWKTDNSRQADMYLVDGRFRVACFMQILFHCRSNPVIGIHDFASREKYHVIKEVAREIATAEDLSIFQQRRDQDYERVRSILATYAYDPE